MFKNSFMDHSNAGVYFYAGVGDLIVQPIAKAHLKILERNLLYPQSDRNLIESIFLRLQEA